MGPITKNIIRLTVYAIIGYIGIRMISDIVENTFASIGDSAGFGKFLHLIINWGGTIMLIIFLISKYKRIPSKQVQQKSIDHGSAEWASRNEFVAKGNGAAEGLWLGDFFRRAKAGHLLTIAGSGAGKNACIILPNLLINPFGSYVVTDPKGENACITARWQQQSGQRVFILDPWNQQDSIGAKHGIPSSGFNPFDFIKENPDDIRDNCELIATYLVPDKPGSKDPYWGERARTLIKTCLMHIVTDMPEERHNFWELYKMMRVSGDNWLNLLADMKLNEGCDGLISIAAEEFMGMDPNGPTIGGIRSNAQNATSIFESPQLRKSLEKSDFNPYDLAQKNCTVYIVIPERYLETHSAWLRLVVGLSLKAVNAKPKNRVNFFLDEFAILGKMKDVQSAYAFSRGQNVVMWAFAQSLSQIKEIYGEDGMNTFLSNTAIFQAFGIKDQYTKEYVSNALGDSTYMKTTASTSDNGKDVSTSFSQQSFGRRLLTPEEVEKCPDIINITEGLKFMIKRIGYFQNRYEGVPKNASWLSQEERKIIKSGQLPEDLREWFAPQADPAPRILA